MGHLDMCAYRTMVVAGLPCVEFPEHGMCSVSIPWAEPNARFAVEFESLVMDWLQEPSVLAVARLMGVSWNAIDTIILKVSNGPAEGINSRIKTVKMRSRGFRNKKKRFANAIYFHLGGLDLYPEDVRR